MLKLLWFIKQGHGADDVSLAHLYIARFNVRLIELSGPKVEDDEAPVAKNAAPDGPKMRKKARIIVSIPEGRPSKDDKGGPVASHAFQFGNGSCIVWRISKPRAISLDKGQSERIAQCKRALID